VTQVTNLTEILRDEFSDPEYRYGYVESHLDSCLAAQIRVLREQRGMTQEQLALAMKTKQSVVSRMEDVNYSAWSVITLKKVARALGVRLKVTFEEFSTLPADLEGFDRESMQRAPFDQDRVFGTNATTE
jgi:ribosome-binding protein aMBF1 (putative translation factor)